MKIVADQDIPFLKGIAEHFGEVTYMAGSDFSNDRVRDADVLIVRTIARMDEIMLRDTNVKLICSTTIGFDHIDTAYCESHGIVWKNAPGCNASSAQQYIVSSLLTIARQKKFDLKGKTIGIVGVGNVGKKVAAACELLEMNVLLNDPPRQQKEPHNQNFVSLDEIKEKADIISFHVPLTRDGLFKTYHMADTYFFDTLGKKPIIINSARGGIIDTEAIKLALKTKKTTGAIIDCWEDEPYIDLEYMELADIATPHIAGYSADGKANATRLAVNALADYCGLSDREPLMNISPPSPPNSIIDLDAFDSNSRFAEAMLATYNPLSDFERLKSSPDSFRQQRNSYPLRREYPAYIIMNADDNERRIFNKFDFRLG